MLPDGWRLKVRERSMGVYEATVLDAHGRTSSVVGLDVDTVIAEATAGAIEIQRQLDEREHLEA